MATSGSATSVKALSLPMPRRVSRIADWSPCWANSSEGTKAASCVTSRILFSFSVAWLKAEMAIGVVCRLVARLVAVTTTSCSVLAAAGSVVLSAELAGGTAVWPSAMPPAGLLGVVAVGAVWACAAVQASARATADAPAR